MGASRATIRTIFTLPPQPTPASLRTDWMPRRVRELPVLLFGSSRVEPSRPETVVTPVALPASMAAWRAALRGTQAVAAQTQIRQAIARTLAVVAAAMAVPEVLAAIRGIRI